MAVDDAGRLGRRAVERGLITDEQLRECLDRQSQTLTDPPPLLGQIFLRRGYLTVEQLVELLGEPPPPTAPSAPRLPDRYRLLHVIGRGATGTVHLTSDSTLGRTVAVKILNPDVASAAKMRQRFEGEARVLARLDHPGIVRIYDAGATGDTLFIVMEFVDGEPIDDFCAQEKPGFRGIAALVAQAADAVQHAHDHGIVHRDLKPANMLVRHAPDGAPRVTVMDFGLARTLHGAAALTAPGMVLGTPLFMSPEQVRGDAADASSDVYALGAVLYALLTRRPPHSAPREYDLFQKILGDDPAPPCSIDARISPELQNICLKALRKEPRQRYANAAALASDLRRWLAGEAISARAPSLTGRVLRHVRRHVALIAVATVVVIAGAVVGSWLMRRSSAQAMAAEARTRFDAGDFAGAKELLDRARDTVAIDEALLRRCELELRRAADIAEASRGEERVFGPIDEELKRLADTPDGWARALRLIEAGLTRYDRSWRAWERKAAFHEKLRQHDEALLAYRRACELNPKLASAHYRCGCILMEALQRVDDAKREFEKAVECDPAHELARVARARIAVIEKRNDEAGRLLDEAEPYAKGVAEFHYLRGFVTELRNDLAAAVESYTRAIEIDDRHMASLNNRAILYGRLGDLPRAVDELTRIIDMMPDHPDAYINRGIARTRLHQHEKAIADLRHSLTLAPRDPVAHANLGIALRATGDFRAAAASFREALQWSTLHWPGRPNVERALRDLEERGY